MCGARHLSGNSCQRLALQIGVIAVTCDVAFVFGSEAVVTLANSDLGRNPERAPQTGITKVGELRLSAKLARLMRRQVETAELQELAMVAERRKSPASARMVIAIIGPMPRICRKRR